MDPSTNEEVLWPQYAGESQEELLARLPKIGLRTLRNEICGSIEYIRNNWRMNALYATDHTGEHLVWTRQALLCAAQEEKLVDLRRKANHNKLKYEYQPELIAEYYKLRNWQHFPETGVQELFEQKCKEWAENLFDELMRVRDTTSQDGQCLSDGLTAWLTHPNPAGLERLVLWDAENEPASLVACSCPRQEYIQEALTDFGRFPSGLCRSRCTTCYRVVAGRIMGVATYLEKPRFVNIKKEGR